MGHMISMALDNDPADEESFSRAHDLLDRIKMVLFAGILSGELDGLDVADVQQIEVEEM